MIAKLIHALHIALLVFLLIVPFTNNEYLLTLHFIIIPFIVLHWVTNQSVCALTEIEKFLSNKTDDEDTFFGKLVGPVYKFKTQEDEEVFLYTLMAALYIMTFIKLQSTGFSQLRRDFSVIFDKLVV